jgi:hypothetical protein
VKFTSKADLLVLFGFAEGVVAPLSKWLSTKKERRAVWVTTGGENPAPALPQLTWMPLQVEWEVFLFAQKIATDFVLLSMEEIFLEKTPLLERFSAQLQSTKRGTDLRLSDGADFGIRLARNAKKNTKAPFGRALDLSFPGVPAVIVGAGPSLEKGKPFFKELKKKALFLSGGNALTRLGLAPHFVGALDPNTAAYNPFPETPICFQARVHPGSVPSKAPRWIVPDSHFAFLNVLSQDARPFDGGWTVGTMLTALALHWGCNPIVWVGMDCAAKTKIDGAKQEKNQKGDPIWVQNDWLLAAEWMQKQIELYPERTFYSASDEGLLVGEPKALSEIEFPERTIEIPLPSSLCGGPAEWLAWQQSLGAKETALTHLLEPVWDLWRPIFDPHPLSAEEKMNCHRELFFEKVLSAHRD